MKRFLKDNERIIIVAVAVALFVTVTTYAMSVSNFSEYDPPNYLNFRWGDYVSTDVGGVSVNNEVTDIHKYTAAYPYRAIFWGAVRHGNDVYDKQNDYVVTFVYCKNPTTDIFTFEYNHSQYIQRDGDIRASFNSNYQDKDVLILQRQLSMSEFLTSDNTSTPIISEWTAPSGFQLGRYQFDFDFFYDCANQHQQNASSLGIVGLSSISGVPYEYSIHCVEHTHATGGGSSGGSGGLSGDKNTGGTDGRHGWGTGDYGGGVNKGDIVSGNDGGGYTSRPGMELNVPDDWQRPVEDNYNSMPENEYVPDYPEYTPSEGDTGQTGEDWELPSWGGDGLSGEINGYSEFKSGGKYGLIDFMSPMEEWMK